MRKTLLAQEFPPPDEEIVTRDLAQQLTKKIASDYAGMLKRRDAHPKMHGLVKAEFIVEANLPESLRIGVFEQARVYPAWIRFSNAFQKISPDIDRDIRGMAIKLMDVPGEKLLEEEKDAQTQDFLLISSNVFLTRDVKEFDQLTRAIVGSAWAKILFFTTHWRLTWTLIKSMKKIANPLQTRYWSSTPYLFGSRAVKYSTQPHIGSADAIPASPPDDFLRQAMIRQLAQGDALFDFSIQFQTDAASMPIEDPSVEWDETVSPFIKVATIRIPAQQFDDEKQRALGENMSFTPWHSLPQHRPLGGINRARKLVYQAISKFRHQQNQVPMREPDNSQM